MKLKLGKGKTNHQRKPADWDKNPIWVNDFDESNYDEEHEKPVVGVTNVNRDVLTAGLVTIALRLPDDTPACGYLSFPEGDKLQAVWIWHKSQWQEPHAIPSLKYPLRLQAVPKMKNKPVEFTLKNARDNPPAKPRPAMAAAKSAAKPRKSTKSVKKKPATRKSR